MIAHGLASWLLGAFILLHETINAHRPTILLVVVGASLVGLGSVESLTRLTMARNGELTMPTTKNTPTEPDPEPTPPEPTPSHDEVMERLVEERGVPTGGPTETEIPEHGVAIGHQDPEAEAEG